MNALEYAAYNNQQYDNGGASSGLQKISDKTIEKIKGFMQNPYSAEFPGIEANTTGDDWAGVIIINTVIQTGLNIISKTNLSAILTI